MKNLLLIAAAAASISASPAWAQDAGVEEIVVTGSRVREWDFDDLPAAKVPRRADNLIVAVRAVNDTRDASQRREELMRTLRAMVQSAAGRPDIDVSLNDDGALVPLQEDMVSTLTLDVEPGRSDTSVASLVVKTPIRLNDTLDSASGRIEAFVKSIRPVGRSLVTIDGDWELSIIDPSQYRPAIIAAIAEDAKKAAAVFGEEYGVEVEGLSNRVTWTPSGPLSLHLFIPYKLTVLPVD